MRYESADSALQCLSMTGLDSSPVGEVEVLHWLVGIIIENDMATGEILCQSLQAFPPFGNWYHRIAFVLTAGGVAGLKWGYMR